MRLLVGIVCVLVIVDSAAAKISDSGCFLGHCLQSCGGVPAFFPNPTTPTPPQCNDNALGRAIVKHMEDRNENRLNAYRHLSSGTFLGEAHKYHIDTPVILCHTGYLRPDFNLTICRHAERDDDLHEADKLPYCSTVHAASNTVQWNQCINLPWGKEETKIDVGLDIMAFMMIPAAYFRYIELVFSKLWPADEDVQAGPNGTGFGALGSADHHHPQLKAWNPFSHAFQSGVGIAVIVAAGLMLGLLDFDNWLRALAPVAL